MTDRKKPMTDEAFAELLLKPDTGADCLACSEADAEARSMRATLGVYREDMLQWAERRSAVQPSLAEKARTQERWAALPRWSLATVALVTILGGLAHLTEWRADVAAPAVALTSTAEPEQPYAPTADELAADNQLLSSIDAELSYHHHSSPVDSLRLHGTDSKPPLTGVTD